MKMKPAVIGLILLVVHAAWFALLFHFPDFCLFIVFLPVVIILNFSSNPKIRNTYISIFVVLWLGLFQYESLRGFLLNEYFKLNLPKTKFLFPPAGW
ncbi:MAG: hypothetical protein K8I00_12390, partial [Candidatus Omnitrophica bacterium]|nr:hypothetical protein [Candidatus Omnitrophota bacterium]